MSRVLDLDEEEMLVTIEPGVEKFQLQKYLAKKGYFFPVDPGSNACMGGYANTGASGTLAVKYGTMRENCRSMTAVLADGRVLERTRARTVKSSAGYNLHQLIIGSEGSLVVVTKLVLPIRPLPRAVLATRSQFKDTAAATDFVAKLMKAGLTQLARAELMNEAIIEAINIYSKTAFQRLPALFLEFHADTPAEAAHCAAQARAIAEQCGALGFESTTDEKELNTMWQARRDAYYAAFKADRAAADAIRAEKLACMSAEERAEARPQKLAIFTTDVCVPVPRLSEVIRFTEDSYAAHASRLPCPIVAHAGDGNFHCMIPYDMNDAAESAAVCELNALMIRKAISVGGTVRLHLLAYPMFSSYSLTHTLPSLGRSPASTAWAWARCSSSRRSAAPRPCGP
jgi:D-lactate dehydrogenase (cytochrome)